MTYWSKIFLSAIFTHSKKNGKVICVPVALPASTLANTPAEGNQRFHLWTESLWIPVTKPGRISAEPFLHETGTLKSRSKLS